MNLKFTAHWFTHLHRTPALAAMLLLAFVISACSSFSLAEDIAPPPGSQQARLQPTQLPTDSGPLYPLVPPNPESARTIYAEKCAPCHGEAGLGDGPQAAQLPNPVAALASPELVRASTPAEWYTQVTRGNLQRFMPPFASLSDRERWDVVAYSFSLSTTPAVLEQGAALYTTNCLACHGALGKGDGPQAASLASAPKDMTDQAYMAEKTANDFFQAISEGVGEGMPGFSANLSEDERWALAAYVRTLSFASAATASASQDASMGITAAPQSASPTAIAADQVASASETGLGTVQGQVTHAGGESLPAGLEVMLRGFDNMQVVYTQTTTLQPDSTYQFLNVDMPVGRAYMVTIDYDQATYGSDIGMVEEGITSLDLPVSVYATTTDSTILRADRLHLFFEFVDQKQVRVIELYIVSNPTDKTLVAAEAGQPTIKFYLPEGAENLEFQDGALGARYIQLPDGFGDTASIRPGSGSYEALFAYTMPYDRKLDLKLKVPMPVDAIVILVPEGQIKLKSDQLQDGGTRDVQGVQYHTYSGSSLAGGVDLLMTLTGRPSGTTPSLAQGSNTDLVIGLSVFGLALILAGVWMYRRSRLQEADDDEDEPATVAAPVESSDTIMDAVIALDDQYQAGNIPEDAYKQRRAELRDRLKDLLK